MNEQALHNQIEALQKRLELEIQKNRKKDKVLFQQNKLISMGEMMDSISHQWRQPLMELTTLFIPIEANIKLNNCLTKEEVLESISKLNAIVKYMSTTIDEFRNFFSKEKEKTNFKITDQINLSVNIIASTLKQHNINLDIVIKTNPLLKGYKNELAQVLINILSNAKDILVQRKILNPKIIISILKVEEELVVTIEDNAGGIKEEFKEKIFDPFFTSEKSNGTGLGLFMSKLIIENNMQGHLSVQNTENGAKFIIYLPL